MNLSKNVTEVFEFSFVLKKIFKIFCDKTMSEVKKPSHRKKKLLV